jgi:hypothetical protein
MRMQLLLQQRFIPSAASTAPTALAAASRGSFEAVSVFFGTAPSHSAISFRYGSSVSLFQRQAKEPAGLPNQTRLKTRYLVPSLIVH